MNCSSLEEITLPTPYTGKGFTIGYAAFMGSGLKSFRITKEMTSIAGAAFNNCNNIELTVEAANTKYSLLDDMFLLETTTSAGVTKTSLISIVNATGNVVISLTVSQSLQ